jgi:hypothetical protein
MLKLYKDFLQSTCKIVDSTDNKLVAVDLKYLLSICIVSNNTMLIAYKDDRDVRFNGKVENVPQLKMILQLIRKNIH